MSGVTWIVGQLLRYSVRLLPADRRDWPLAVWAEADDVAAGRARLGWLLGGLWLVAKEARVLRRVVSAVVLLTAGVVLVRLDWRAGSSDPAVAVHRVQSIVSALILIGLPVLTSWPRLFGPVADSGPARVLRTGAYAVLWVLIPVVFTVERFAGLRFGQPGGTAADQAQWRSEATSRSVGGAVELTLVITLYAVLILWLTSRRAAVPPVTLAVGTVVGAVTGSLGYGLAPVGGLLEVRPGWLVAVNEVGRLVVLLGGPVLAGWLAARLARRRADRLGRGDCARLNPRGSARAAGLAASAEPDRGTPVRHALLAGLAAAALGALLLTVFTLPTMLHYRQRIHVEWANPDPNVPHGTPFEVQMTIGDDLGRYAVLLLFAPLLGVGLGTIGLTLDPAALAPSPAPAAGPDPLPNG